jgi:hypothetical protein
LLRYNSAWYLLNTIQRTIDRGHRPLFHKFCMRGRKDEVGQGRSAPAIFSHTGSTEGTNPVALTPGAGGERGKLCTLPRTVLPSRFFQRQEVELKFVFSHSKHVQTEVLTRWNSHVSSETGIMCLFCKLAGVFWPQDCNAS